jgi:hypothetical protein
MVRQTHHNAAAGLLSWLGADEAAGRGVLLKRSAVVIFTLLALALPLAGLVGCGPKVKITKRVPPTAIRPAQDATLDQLLLRYRAWTDSIHTLNATAQLFPTAGSSYSGVIEQYHDVRVFVLAERPGKLRMIGQAPIVHTNIFDMTTDGERFKISIPPKKKFIVGLNRLERVSKKPIENLRPEHLVQALLPPPLAARLADAGLRALMEEWEAPPYRYYVVSFLHGELVRGGVEGETLEIKRKIWFDRADLSVVRIQMFSSGGRLASDTTYDDYGAFDGITYPRSITLWRPRDDYRLVLQVQKLIANQPLAAEKFELAQPPGSELVELEATKDGSR